MTGVQARDVSEHSLRPLSLVVLNLSGQGACLALRSQLVFDYSSILQYPQADCKADCKVDCTAEGGPGYPTNPVTVHEVNLTLLKNRSASGVCHCHVFFSAGRQHSKSSILPLEVV